MAEPKRKPKKLYLCNRQRCGENCSWPTCRATTDVEYALDISAPFELYEPTGDFMQKGCFEE